MPDITSIDVATVRRWLGDGGEIAFIDVREDGQHGAGHPLLAVGLPYSRLELGVGQLVPRRSCRIVLVDDGDGVAARAARRLAALGYGAVHPLEGGIAGWAAQYPLFPSTNVPSKAFAEIVEHDYGTPAITAAELDRRRRRPRSRRRSVAPLRSPPGMACVRSMGRPWRCGRRRRSTAPPTSSTCARPTNTPAATCRARCRRRAARRCRRSTAGWRRAAR